MITTDKIESTQSRIYHIVSMKVGSAYASFIANTASQALEDVVLALSCMSLSQSLEKDSKQYLDDRHAFANC